ncbi:MAG: gamma-glutamylcyclotransferase family protein [Pseudomonadota bacterium]
MTITYFGYGSLVNVDTVPANTQVTPGRLSGWVREWRVCGMGNDGQGRCALTVREDKETEIWGVLATEPRERLGELEQREKRYRKVEKVGPAFRCEAEGSQGPDGLFLFKALPEHHRWGSETHPILQSYLDCVLAGFFRVWGERGIHHFLETTDGWHVPVLQDRNCPRYPRSIQLQTDLADLIDHSLKQLGVGYIEPGT